MHTVGAHQLEIRRVLQGDLHLLRNLRGRHAVMVLPLVETGGHALVPSLTTFLRSPLPAQWETSTSQHLPCPCSSEALAHHRPCQGCSSETPPLVGKPEVSSALGQLPRTGEARERRERFSCWEEDSALIPSEVETLGEYICPAHTGETVALPPLPWADQKLLHHTEQAQAKLLFWHPLQVSHQTARAGRGYLLMGGLTNVLRLDNGRQSQPLSAGQPLLGGERQLLLEGRGSQLKGKKPARASEMPSFIEAFLVHLLLMSNL